MYKLILTATLHEELDCILLHISDNLKNPTAATNLLNEVARCYEHLKSNPKIYETCQDERLCKINLITKSIGGLYQEVFDNLTKVQVQHIVDKEMMSQIFVAIRYATKIRSSSNVTLHSLNGVFLFREDL